MMGPLSGKQQRDYMSFAAKEEREQAKMLEDERRKEELHQLKLKEAAKKADQSIEQKHDQHAAKMSELGGPLSSKPAPISTEESATNFVEDPNHPIGETDTVPTMLTPGEAVIPRAAAQDPNNKPIIEAMVNQGREQQAMGFAKGTTSVPRLSGKVSNDDMVAILPKVGPRRKLKGYSEGTTSVGEVPPPVSVSSEFWRRVREMDFSRAARTPTVPVQVVPQMQPQMVEMNGVSVPRVPAQVVVVPQANQRVAQPILPSWLVGTKHGNAQEVLREQRQKIQSGEESNRPVQGYSEGGFVNETVPPVQEMRRSGTEADLKRQVVFDTQDQAYYGSKVSEQHIAREKAAGYAEALNDPKLPASVRAQLLKESQGIPVPVMPVGVPNSIPTQGPTVPAGPLTPQQQAIADAEQSRIARARARAANSKDPVIVANAEKIIANAPVNQPNMDFGAVPVPYKGNAGRGTQGVGQYDIPPISEQNPVEKPYDPATERINTELPPVAQVKLDALGEFGKANQEKLGKIESDANAIADPAEKKSFLEKAFSGLFGDSGIFNDRELTRAAILFAGGVATGGSVKGSLRYAGLDTLQQSDRRLAAINAEKMADKRATQAETLYEKRAIDAEDRQIRNLESREKLATTKELRRMGYKEGDIKGYLDGKPLPALPTTATPTGNYQDPYTVDSDIKLEDGTFIRRGQPIPVQEIALYNGNDRTKVSGKSLIATINGKQIPLDSLTRAGGQVTKWDVARYGSVAQAEQTEKFARDAGKQSESILKQEFSKNPEKLQGSFTPEEVSNGVASWALRNKLRIEDPKSRADINTIANLATRQAVQDIRAGNTVADITTYLDAADFRSRSGLSDKLFMVDEKKQKMMAPQKLVQLQSLIANGRGVEAVPTELQRLETVWNDPKNKAARNRYLSQPTKDETPFYMFAKDAFKPKN